MSDWSKQRKLNIQVSFVVIVFAIFIFSAFVLLYDRPSCTDGLHNQGEESADCGGPCPQECVFDITKPAILWGRAFRISPTLHSLIYYIENKNTKLTAKNLPYTIRYFDENGEQLGFYKNIIDIYPSFITPIFVPHIKTGARNIETTNITFDEKPNWQPATTKVPQLLTLNQRIEYIKRGGARGYATIVNETVSPINDIDIYAVVYDQRGNAVSAASTYIQTLKSKEERDVIFTWVNDIEPIEYVCNAKSDLFLINSEGVITPQMVKIKNKLKEILKDSSEIEFISKPVDYAWANAIDDSISNLDKTNKLYFAIIETDSNLTKTIELIRLLNDTYNISAIVFTTPSISESIKRVISEKNLDASVALVDFDDVSVRFITQEIKFKKCKGSATSIEILTVPNI